ncbi:MAG: cupredoxin domain-containing protein [Acidiferrobacterales bacterium]
MKNILRGLLACGALTIVAVQSAAADGMADMPGMSMPHTGHDGYGVPGLAGAVTKTVTVTALDTMRFEPARVSVNAGQTVRFIIRNAGKIAHEFVIGDRVEQSEHEAEMQANPKMKMDRDPNGVTIGPGRTQELIWKFPEQAGKIEYACHEPGHFAAGMVGYVHVVRIAGNGTR